MPYVTQDKRVVGKDGLIAAVKTGQISRETFVESVKALGFLDWEVVEAVKKLDGDRAA